MYLLGNFFSHLPSAVKSFPVSLFQGKRQNKTLATCALILAKFTSIKLPFTIGIKDILECFMLVLNDRSADIKATKPKGPSALIQPIDSLKSSQSTRICFLFLF